MEDMVCPVFPELYASGAIINGFTPDDKRQTDSLMHAIREFNVDVVLVIDNERLERDITKKLADVGREGQTIVVKVPKSSGISPSR
jgi:hypothetical protein